MKSRAHSGQRRTTEGWRDAFVPQISRENIAITRLVPTYTEYDNFGIELRGRLYW